MLRIYDKVKEMKSQRIFLLNKLRDEVQNDDITKKLILYKNRDLTDVFSSELKKYDSSLNFLRTNLEAQGNILKIFADINAKYVDTRCTISELLSARKEMINSLIQSYHTYDDLLHKTAKGLQFYDKLESNVAKALSKAKGVVKVQAEERDALIAKNSPRRMPTLNGGGGGGFPSAPPPSSSSGKPTLKDYLNAMKGHEAGKESPTHGVTPHYNHVAIPKQSNEKEDSASPVVAPPIAYPPPRSTYTSGTLPSSNNLSLATASPQIQQQEQIRQYYSPPNTTAAYQYPASASSNASIIPGTHPSPQSKEPNSMNKNTSYVQQPNNYYGQSYYYNTNPGANTNASPYMQPQHVTPQKPSHSNNNNPYGQYNSPSQTPHHPYVSQQYAANAYNNYQSQQAYTHKYNIPPNNSSNTIPGGAYSPTTHSSSNILI
ncbi:Uncharacterized protein FKW44_023202 [Caligus rogercresseyi]|uniref:ALIX V-shaped domain-containing protein n=1 Tax=Caligus rogercresseyi TaxID=217165 RepID=A0A7T8JUJ7_CALRO|nr:Uncharacterized protein FKW44_023202 [Caligus rogercresseyi]